IQLRGVSEDVHPMLLRELIALGLVNSNPSLDALRPTVMPFWREGDLSDRLGASLAGISLPDLPDKMGIVIDTWIARIMPNTPGDFRFEVTQDQTLILRADGAERGWEIGESEATEALGEMARWFVETGGANSGRMAKHLTNATLPAAWQTALPGSTGDAASPGEGPKGYIFGVPFGQTDADALEILMTTTQATGLRVTPWRL
ncbi:unnamed protein product, partial [Ectocarpus sp. 12 AP-2014]